MRISKALARAMQLETITYEAIVALEKNAPNGRMDSTTASAMARLVAAWQTCCERVLIAKGKPLTVKPASAGEASKKKREWYGTPPAPQSAANTHTAANGDAARPSGVEPGHTRAATDTPPLDVP